MVCVWITLTLNHSRVYKHLSTMWSDFLILSIKGYLLIQVNEKTFLLEVTISNFLDVQKVEKDEILKDIQMRRMLN